MRKTLGGVGLRAAEKMAKNEDYKYLEIRDAIASINQKVSLIGVVLEFGFPKNTRGSDYFCTMKIIDESHSTPGVPVNFFAETVEKLPHVMSPGHIIQVNRVTMKTHNREVYALFDKKLSSFAIYGGKDVGDFIPYQSSPSFRPRDLDFKLITGLRKWLVDFELDEGSSNFLFLREIRKGKEANLTCKILHTYEVSKDEWMAFVWDGTDCSPVSIDTKPEDEKDTQLPLQLEPLPLPRDILCTFPTVGTILRIIIDKGNQKHVLHLLHIGKWVKFLNIRCEVHAGLWRGFFTPFTKLRYIANNDFLKLERQRSYDERLSIKYGHIPYWSFPWCSRITEVDYEQVPFVTLMDAITHSEVTAKFKCMVRVVDAFPWQAEDFCSCAGTYRIRLTLEDPTARIHAFVYADDGEEFFDGHPSIDTLKRKRNKLLGVAVNDDGKEIKDAPRDPPWVQCCLKSYYLDKNDIWGSRHYRIFGTRNVG